MPDATDLSSMHMQPSPEATTAGALFALAEKLALSDEPGSTNMATELSKRANIVAKLEIRIRTDEYTKLKGEVDAATGELARNIQQIKQARELVKKARDIATMLDTLIKLAADLIP